MKLEPGLLYMIVYGPGFGETIVVREPQGIWVVIDGCLLRGRSPAADLLRRHEASWSCVILTHPHEDHVLGLPEVLECPGEGPIGCVAPRAGDPRGWTRSTDPERHLRQGTMEQVLAMILERWRLRPSCRWELQRGQVRELGELALSVLHPPAKREIFLSGDPNRLSSALLLCWHDVRLLLGADTVAVDWEEIGQGDLDVARHHACKVPHHGALGAAHDAWGEGCSSRAWIVTPFNRGRKLPSFEDEGGLAWALRRVDRVHLTGLPVKARLQGKIPLETTRERLRRGAHGVSGDLRVGAIALQPLPEPDSSLESCFVAMGFSKDGSLQDLRYGAGAVVVTEETADA
jgi:hypothetical protein